MILFPAIDLKGGACVRLVRGEMASANVPCCSSQARTQREHTMHSSSLKRKYGLLASTGRAPVSARELTGEA